MSGTFLEDAGTRHDTPSLVIFRDNLNPTGAGAAIAAVWWRM